MFAVGQTQQEFDGAVFAFSHQGNFRPDNAAALRKPDAHIFCDIRHVVKRAGVSAPDPLPYLERAESGQTQLSGDKGFQLSKGEIADIDLIVHGLPQRLRQVRPRLWH